MRPCAVLGCAVLLCMPCAARAFGVSCCHLSDAFHAHIATHTNVKIPRCDPATCWQLQEIQLVLREMHAAWPALGKGADALTVDWTREGNDADMARVIIWSLIGRRFTSSNQDKFLEYDVTQKTLRESNMLCELQRPLFVTMVLVLITALLVMIWAQGHISPTTSNAVRGEMTFEIPPTTACAARAPELSFRHGYTLLHPP